LYDVISRAPAEAFDRVEFLAAAHLFILIYSQRNKKFLEMVQVYEKRFSALPKDSTFRNNTLGSIYCLLGSFHLLKAADPDESGGYFFDKFYAKAAEHFKTPLSEKIQKIIMPYGSWISTLGSSKAEALSEYTKAAEQSSAYISRFYSRGAGREELYLGELSFYRNEPRKAESLFAEALQSSRDNNQHDAVQRALFYSMRIAIMLGDRGKVKQTLKDLEALLDEKEYLCRNFVYDVSLGWYYCTVRQFDLIPDWFKDDFSPYAHAHFLENYANQIKARYHYLKRNYSPLLTYISEMKERESILYGRVEMLAMEACVHYQMKNKPAAWDSLRQAYETALPNNIIMPFIELGKDMRTLVMSALREAGLDIPHTWLESIRKKASSYAKNQSLFVTSCEESLPVNKTLSPRERDVLSDLYYGATQAEIAKRHSLSINTVKMVTKSIYEKLNVHKISDLIRIAAEQKLV
jgi:LuxR family maltose regulon positive regulatory protein